jgi:hypothetical protein
MAQSQKPGVPNILASVAPDWGGNESTHANHGRCPLLRIFSLLSVNQTVWDRERHVSTFSFGGLNGRESSAPWDCRHAANGAAHVTESHVDEVDVPFGGIVYARQGKRFLDYIVYCCELCFVHLITIRQVHVKWIIG